MPLKKKIENIKLVQPVTENPQLNLPYTSKKAIIVEKVEIRTHNPIANFKGLSEKAMMISEASFIRFFNE